MQTAILNIGQLVTMAGSERPRVGPEMRELGLVSNGGILVRDGVIHAAGKSAQIESQLRVGDDVVDAEGRLVTPGFVDAHTHAVFAGNRSHEFEMRAEGQSYQRIKESGGGILSSVRTTRDATEEDLFRSASRHLQWMLENGTTTVEVKSGYGLDLASELRILEVANRLEPQRVHRTFLGAHSVPPGKAKGDYLDEVVAMLPEIEILAQACDVFVEDGYFRPDDARRLFEATKLARRLHVDQFGDHGGAALAAELNAMTADHLEHTGIDGIHALKSAGVAPVLLPASVYCLSLTKYADARTMIEVGLPVVLATDFNPGTAPCPSIPFVMSLACTQMKMTPAESMTACTINAAHALGCSSQVGSIEVGKQADFVLHDADDFREISYWTGRSTVSRVWIAGRRVLG